MGIKNLVKLIKTICPEVIQTADLNQFSGKKVAIDTSIYMYRFMYSLKISKSVDGSPLEGFIRQVAALTNYGIIPLYVFDGKPPEEKRDTIKDRIERKDKTTDKINELNTIKKSISEKKDSGETVDKPFVCKSGRSYNTITEVQNDIDKLDRRVLDVKPYHFEECKELFRLMGVPFIVACGEAEGLCAKLVKDGYVDAAISEDTDLYPCGTPRIIKDFNPDKSKITVSNLNDILEKMDITYEQLIDISILCGCDYLKCTIRGIGPKRAYEFIKELGSIEKVIEVHCGEGKKYKVPDSFDYHAARNLFLESGCATDLTGFKVEMKTPDIGELLLFCNRFYLSKKWRNYLEKSYFIKAKKLVKTSSLESFFLSRVGST